MSSEDDDYMSEKFSTKGESSKCDIKPGLIRSIYAKRQHEKSKKTVESRESSKKPKPYKITEEERRQKGLEKPISSDNKGFSMLQKMGYKPGESIGKSATGQTEPINVVLKSDRFGLGRETALKEIAERKAQIRADKLKKREEMCDIESYRKRISELAQENHTRNDLRKSQRICETLDKQKDIDSPAEPWFWIKVSTDSESDEEEEDLEPFEKLQLITNYLRSCHLYCLWCCTSFDDKDDMGSNCPGRTREHH